jgi:hypothetical protein
VYKSTKNKENDKLIISTENFLASIIKQHKALEQGEKQTFLILGGDWNNELNPSLDRAYVGMNNAPRSIKTNCSFLKKATSGSFGLTMTDIWRMKHPALIDYTHSSQIKQGKSEARLDYFLTCPNATGYTSTASHDSHFINGMHHKGINLTLEIPITRLSSRKKNQRKTKNSLHLPRRKRSDNHPCRTSRKRRPFPRSIARRN